MAENYVENFSFGEDDDEQTFQVKDPEAIEAEGGELANAIITYDNETTTVQSWTDFISNFVSGTKVAKWFKDFKAGVEYVLHVGSLVNNCVTNNAELPLAAAQGKVLMDEVTQLNSALTMANTTLDGTALGSNPIYLYKYGNVKSFDWAMTHEATWEASTEYSICTLPSEYRPVHSFSKFIVYKTSGSNNCIGMMSVSSDGSVTITPLIVATGGITRVHESYL